MQNLEQNYDRLIRAFAHLNKLFINERIKCMKPVEQWHLDSMNAYPIRLRGKLLDSWQRSDLKADKRSKLDCVCGDVWGQQKIRIGSSGNDILQCLIQPSTKAQRDHKIDPWKPKSILKAIRLIDEGKLKESDLWGRDWKFEGHIYNCLSRDMQIQRIISAERCKAMQQQAIKEWMKTNKELTNFTASNGIQLVKKTDSGRGYDGGLRKVLGFVPMDSQFITERPMLPPTKEVWDMVEYLEKL